MVTEENYPMFSMFCSCEKSISRKKNRYFPLRNFRLLYYPELRYTAMLKHLSIQFTFYYLSSGRLRGVEKKSTFQTFSSKSGRGRLREVVALQEVPNIVI